MLKHVALALFLTGFIGGFIGAAIAQEKPTAPTASVDQVKALRDEVLAQFASERRYTDAQFAAQKEAMSFGFLSQREATQSALAAADRAVNKAEDASTKRFDSVNEFRSTLSDQQRTLMPRAEAELLVKGLEGRVSDLSEQLQKMQARNVGISDGWGYAVAVVVLAVTAISLAMLFRKKQG